MAGAAGPAMGSQDTPTPATLLPNPFTNANILPCLTYGFVAPLMRKGEDVCEGNVWKLTESDETRSLLRDLAAAWDKSVASGKPNLTRAFFAAFMWRYAFWSIVLALKAACALASTQFLALLLDELRAVDGRSPTAAYLYALGLVLSGLAVPVLHHLYFFHAWRAGMRWRAAATALVFRKCLSVRLDALAAAGTGHILTVVSSDIERFQNACQYFCYMLVAPLESAVIIGLLWRELGVATFAGIAVLVVVVTLQSSLSRVLGRMRSGIARISDERVGLTGQVVAGARVLKVYAWEPPFAAQVAGVRAREIQRLRRAACLRGISEGLYVIAPLIVGAASFLTLYALGTALTARSLFVSLTLFTILQLEMTKFFPLSVESVSESRITLARMQNILLMPEVPLLEGAAAPSSADADAAEAAAAASAADVSVGMSDLSAPAIDVDNLSCQWQSTDATSPAVPVLHHLSFRVKRSELCAVVGAVGSGKSSLLMALMHELQASAGRVSVSGTIAYVSQAPFIMTGTVRENITFGRAFDADRYSQVLEACCLRSDLELLSHGDATIIGERGVNLSGGQRARIALARACYIDADIVLLDDPLSAVDARVARSLFEKCICGFLRARTRILVTHQLQFLRTAHNIIVLERGRLLVQGTFGELSSAVHASEQGAGQSTGQNGASAPELAVGATLAELLREFMEEEQALQDDVTGLVDEADTAEELEEDLLSLPDMATETGGLVHPEPAPSRRNSVATIMSQTSTARSRRGSVVSNVHRATSSRTRQGSTGDGDTASPKPAVAGDADAGPAALIQAEKVQTGTVGRGVYYRYWQAAGGWLVIVYQGLLLCGGIVLITMASVSLASWANASPSTQGEPRYRALYGGLVAGSLVMSMWRAIAFFLSCLSASNKLHDDAFSRVLRAPILFFDSNPTGRILNRFAKDVGLLVSSRDNLQEILGAWNTPRPSAVMQDDLMPITYFDFLHNFTNTLGVLALICAINPWLLLPCGVLAVAFFYLKNYYMLTARAVKRIESITRSPVLSQLNEALSGLPIIRGFRMQNLMIDRFLAAQDANNRGYFAFLVTSRWFGLRLDALCLVLMACAAFASVAVRSSVSAALVGLSLSQISSLMGAFQWTVRQSTMVANLMIATERVLEYTDLPAEDVDIKQVAPAARSPDAWPQAGAVSFNNVWMRYREDLPHVLRGVTFSVAATMKVGVVGRTGAGKSTLFSALLRLVEPDRRPKQLGLAGAARTDGVEEACIPVGTPDICGIEIDGVDVATVHLSVLRRACSVIPQDPVLFAGTIRTNLDPFNQHTDAEIHVALQRVQLADFVQQHGGLSLPVADGGSSLSVGQRQLVCLARAILRQTRVLLVDECSANIDMDTDRAIQSALRTAFAGSTVITIAHRIATIIDSDRVLFMEAGQALEFGHPHTLLQDPSSKFALLVAETGEKMAAVLAREASAAYNVSRFRDAAVAEVVNGGAAAATLVADDALSQQLVTAIANGGS